MRAVASLASALFRVATATSKAARKGTWSMTKSVWPLRTVSPSLVRICVMHPDTCGRTSTICRPVSLALYSR